MMATRIEVTMQAPEPRERPTARILLVDALERILLFRIWLDGERAARGRVWITPGGGVQPGESLAEAAARELREETGLRLDPVDLGPVVARSSGEWGQRRRYRAVDWFFHVRVPELAVDTAGFMPEERRLVTGHRWWTRAEIELATEPILPFGLLPLLERLFAGERPEPPMELPWRSPRELGP
jgi:8-oxo-dGTP pyrophosphatase MutT (NUDIX family)